MGRSGRASSERFRSWVNSGRDDQTVGTAALDPSRKPHLLVARRDIRPDVGAAPTRAFLLRARSQQGYVGAAPAMPDDNNVFST